MARKNQWEQFANNFSTFYDLGNKLQTGIGAKKIMADEVTYGTDESYSNAEGIKGPHRGDAQWMYDGKKYKEEITAEQLTGLRNKRLSDNMVKFGDSAGAMDFNLKNAQLRAANVKADLDEGSLKGLIDRVKIENDAKIASMDLTKTEMARIKKLQPYEVQTYLANIAAKKQETAYNAQLQPNRVLKSDSETAILGDQERVSKEDTDLYMDAKSKANRAQVVENETVSLANENRALTQAGKIQISTYENELATAIFESGEAKTMAEARKLAAERNLQGNKTLSEFATAMKEGGDLYGAGAVVQQKWLQKRWQGDAAVQELISSIGANDLQAITLEGSRLMAEVNNAFTLKTPAASQKAIVDIIDMQDGIEGNITWSNEDGVITMIETAENGDVTTSMAGAKGKDDAKAWSNFKERFYGEMTPLKSLEIAKANAEINKLNAETEYTLGRVGEAQTAAQLAQWSEHKDSETYRVAADKARSAHLKTGSKEPFDLGTWQEEYKNNWLADYPVIPDGVQVKQTSGLGS